MTAPGKIRSALTKRGTFNWVDAILAGCQVVAAIIVFVTGMALLFDLPGTPQ